MILHNRMRNNANSLRNWNKALFSDACIQLLMDNEIILRLGVAQESRPLTLQELNQNGELKQSVLGWATIE